MSNPTPMTSPPRRELCRRQHSSTGSNSRLQLIRFRYQQCRTPSTVVYRFQLRLRCLSTMSNSIDQLYVKSSLVEFHQHLSKVVCCLRVNNVELHRPSKMIRPVFSLAIAVEQRHGELSSCAIHTLNTCNLTSTRPSAASDSKKSKVFKSNY